MLIQFKNDNNIKMPQQLLCLVGRLMKDRADRINCMHIHHQDPMQVKFGLFSHYMSLSPVR
jgi:hypothetical protein